MVRLTGDFGRGYGLRRSFQYEEERVGVDTVVQYEQERVDISTVASVGTVLLELDPARARAHNLTENAL